MDANKQAEIASRTEEFIYADRSKPFYHGPDPWLAWSTVVAVLGELGIAPGASILDVGVGTGWTTLLLAESGYAAHGVDLVPANVEAAAVRAERWRSKASFGVADMDTIAVDESFDHVLVVDALHHSLRQRDVLAGLARHVPPGGWLILGEPGVLHGISPSARRVAKELGWVERGIALRALRKDLAATGFGEIRRFLQPTAPAVASPRALLWQAARLAGAGFGVGPQMHNWVAARRREP